MHWSKLFIVPACITLCLCGQLAAATIDVDTVIGPDHPYRDEPLTVVDGASPPTTVTILDGALLGDFPGGPEFSVALDVYGQSRVRMLGGEIFGSEPPVLLHDRSLFEMTGGSLGYEGMMLRDSSRAILNGGNWGKAIAYGNSRVEINGGEGGAISYAYDNARIVLKDGYPHDVHIRGDSTFVMHGGIVPESIVTEGRSRAMINSGGTYIMVAHDDSQIVMRGGYVADTIAAIDRSKIHLYGYGLHYTHDDLNPNVKYISGTMADGTRLLANYRMFDQGQIILHEVSEPAAGALLAIGAAGLAWGVRRRG
jgi:hypothetical protein